MGSAHLILVGGLVPPLLTQAQEEPHVGTADIDFLMSIAFAQGATREYYESIEEKLTRFFEPVAGSGFRWRKKSGVGGAPIVVDFLAPEDPAAGTAIDGTRLLTDQTAAANAGPRLRPLTLRTQDLLEFDSEEVEQTVDLVYQPVATRAEVRLRHTGPVGFLVAKAFALNGRDEPKDGYDVSWFCINADSDPEALAERLAQREAFSHPLVPEGIAILRKAFAASDYVGPTGYALTVHGEETADSEIFEQARLESYIAVSGTLEGLRRRINWGSPALTDDDAA
jgi:hypothetical protein